MYSSTGIGASNYVSTFDTAFYFTAGISLLLLIALTVIMIWFIYRYNRKKNKVATQIEGNTTLEIVWTVIPVMLALLMFYFGWEGWRPTANPPKEGMTVTSLARMWNFSFIYPNGKSSPDLIVPVNSPVKINLVSLDVIHSLFIPDFRIKSDMVPGREKIMWFIPQAEGDFSIFCAEYCGLQHSYMHSKVTVLTKEKFDSWYIDTTKVAAVVTGTGPGAEGEAIMIANGCFACHSTDGTKIIGPSYLKLFGESQLVLRDGKEVTIVVNEDYIKKSVLDPNSEIVKGYPKGLMQSYSSTLKDEDILKIVEYLKTLNEK